MGKPSLGSTSSNIWTYAMHGDVASVERLIKEGEDIDVQNKIGESAAHMAAKNGHVSCVRA